MTAISDNNDSTSTDSGDESVFYDANSSPTTNQITISLQQEPRWRIPSKQETSTISEHVGTLTESQLHDVQRRDKLQRLRGQDHQNGHAVPVTPATESSAMVPASSEITEQALNHRDSTAVDHPESESIQHSEKNSTSSTRKQTVTNSYNAAGDSYSSPYSTLPATSARGSGGYYSHKKSFSTASEPGVIDLKTIDRITKFGELAPNTRKLDDDEILQQPIVRNLDDGKYIPLSDANPMNETIMERVRRSESVLVVRRNSLINPSHILRKKSSENNRKSVSSPPHNTRDNESISSGSSNRTAATSCSTGPPVPSTVRRVASIRRNLTDLVMRNILRRGKTKTTTDTADDDEDETERTLINDGSNGDLKYKASRYSKEQIQFDRTQLLQTIVNAHDGPIWCMRFSPDGHLLATGGQDALLKVWAFRLAQSHLDELFRSTPNASEQQNEMLIDKFQEFHRTVSTEPTTTVNAKLGLQEAQAPLYTKPFCELSGHQAPVLDVAWSKSLFLLSSSMDKTVRLWHLSRSECLCYFRHVDFVSAIAFHPRDDRFFVSASLDGHVRVWNIPDKRVIHWTLIPAQASSQITAAQANLITAVNFCDDGRKVTVGTFDGRFLLYTDSLRYDTVMNIGDKDGSRSHRSRKKRRKPYKITGIEAMNSSNSKVLITSNDSRIRLYDIRSKEILQKYRGYSNQSSQIRASFSHDDQYIISGSEDSWFYIWRTEPDIDGHSSSINSRLTRRQRRYFGRAYERIRVHNTMVTSAVFAPNPLTIMNYLYSLNEATSIFIRPTSPRSSPHISNNRTRFNCLYHSMNSSEEASVILNTGPLYVMVTADSKGQLKLLVNRYRR